MTLYKYGGIILTKEGWEKYYIVKENKERNIELKPKPGVTNIDFTLIAKSIEVKGYIIIVENDYITLYSDASVGLQNQHEFESLKNFSLKNAVIPENIFDEIFKEVLQDIDAGEKITIIQVKSA